MTKKTPMLDFYDPDRDAHGEMYTVGEIIRQAIEAAGLTVTAAAEKIGINRVNLSHILADRKPVSLAMCRRIGEALNISPYGLARLQLERDFSEMMAGR